MVRSRYVSLKNASVFQSRTEFLEKKLPRNSLKLLDVGNLGDGVLNVDVKTMVEVRGGEYYGLDVNANLAKEIGDEHQLVGDLHDLRDAVEDETFDVLYMGQVIEHTWRPAEMISECYRILRPGGFLILDTPNVFDVWNILRNYVLRKDTLGLDDAELVYNEAADNFRHYREEQKELLSQPQHKILFGPAMLRQLLNMNGFNVESISYIGKSRNPVHGLLIWLFPRGSQKLGVVARKSSLEEIFGVN